MWCWKMPSPWSLLVFVLTLFQLEAACFGKIKTVLHENLTFFSILYQIQSFPPSKPPKMSYLKAFCSDLCWRVVRDNDTCPIFYTAFLPNTMTKNNIFRQTLLLFILHNHTDFTFSVPVESVSIFFLLHSLCFHWMILSLWFFSFFVLFFLIS